MQSPQIPEGNLPEETRDEIGVLSNAAVIASWAPLKIESRLTTQMGLKLNA